MGVGNRLLQHTSSMPRRFDAAILEGMRPSPTSPDVHRPALLRRLLTPAAGCLRSDVERKRIFGMAATDRPREAAHDATQDAT